jgi:hypothetical protein
MAERCIKAYVPPLHGRIGRNEPDTTARRSKRQPRMIARTAMLMRAGHRSRYRLHKQAVEPVFGQIKQARGFRQFLLRGLHKARGEWAMLCTLHNLLRLVTAH